MVRIRGLGAETLHGDEATKKLILLIILYQIILRRCFSSSHGSRTTSLTVLDL